MQRRRKALLWVGILALAVSFIFLSDAYSPTAGHSAGKFLKWHAAKDMEVVMGLDQNYITKYHLCANEHQLLLLRSDYELFRGWNSTALYSIYNGGTGAGIVRIFFNEGAGQFALAFGGVDTPGAERLVLYKTEDTAESVAAITPEETVKIGDTIYFMKKLEEITLTSHIPFEKYTTLAVYGEYGKLLEEMPISFASMNHN